MHGSQVEHSRRQTLGGSEGVPGGAKKLETNRTGLAYDYFGAKNACKTQGPRIEPRARARTCGQPLDSSSPRPPLPPALNPGCSERLQQQQTVNDTRDCARGSNGVAPASPCTCAARV